MFKFSLKVDPGIVPNLDSTLSKWPTDNAYFRKTLGRIKGRREQTISEKIAIGNEFQKFVNEVFKAFDPLLSDRDKDEILERTVASGWLKPSHVYLEETGTLNFNNHVKYPKPLVAYLINRVYKKSNPKFVEEDGFKGMVRGTNQGWPILVGGGNREAADLVLALNLAATMGAQKRGIHPEEVVEFLKSKFGPAFSIYGERYQSTDKVIPLNSYNTWFASKNLEVRVRAIIMMIKILLFFNKSKMNRIIKVMLDTDQHTQDKKEISKRLKTWKERGWNRVPFDVSKSDHHNGGNRADSVVPAFCEFFGVDESHMSAEWNQPIVMPYKDMLVTSTEKYPMMVSGASFTTPFTTVINEVNMLIAVGCKAVGTNWRELDVTYKDVIAFWDKNLFSHFDYLSYGDDFILSAGPDFPVDLNEVQDILDTIDMKGDTEDVLKYLGTVYENYKYSGSITTGYSFGRFVQQQFFPERSKTYPFDLIGYVARTELTPDPEGIHAIMRNYWKKDWGQYFPWSRRHEVIESLLPLVEKHADKIGQLDDVLNTIVQGIRDEDTHGDLVPEEFEYLTRFLGVNTVSVERDNLDDLASKLDIPPAISGEYRRLMDGNLASYLKIAEFVKSTYNLNWTGSAPMF